MPTITPQSRLSQFILGALIIGMAPSALHADGGKEFVTAHTMPGYPGSVAISEGERAQRLSKDSLELVEQFYRGKLRPGDRIEPFSKGDSTGFCIVYAEQAGGRELKANELCASKKASASTAQTQAFQQTVASAGVTISKVDHPAFNEMSALVTRGMHSETELRAAEKEYGEVGTAYYRTVQDAQTGKSISEGELIVKRAHKAAHPNEAQLKEAGKQNKVSAEDKAAAQEVKRQMQELKAKGDIAGMMQLAQSRKEFQGPSANQQQSMQLAMADLQRDTWPIWINCLQELKAVGYATKIVYSSGVLAE